MPKPPNILLVMADQLAPHFTGTYGHPLVRTPNLDRLAERGARFDAAYCNAPLCAPARFSFLAGQLGSRIGAYDNASEFPASVPTLAHYLRLMGYRTCLAGKMHFVGPDQLHGFEERLTTDIYPSDHAWTPNWEKAEERIGKWYHNMDSVREAGSGATTFQLEFDDEAGFFSRRRLFDFAKKGAEPFFMTLGFIHPHDPYVARPEWWNLYRDEEIPLPETRIPWEQQDPHSKRVMTGIEADPEQAAGIAEQQIRNARHGYFANTSYIDAKLGELIQTLEEAGLADNTLVIFTADHGDMLGERGLWYKMTFFERSVRVPLVMAGPGIGSGLKIANACSLLDLPPTLLEAATEGGAKVPDLGQRLEGRSLLPLAAGGGTGDPDETAAEYLAECTGHPLFMLRRGSLKYIHCDSDPAQLYDLSKDPEELTNLAGDPAHAETAAGFAGAVAARWDSAAIRAAVIASQRRRRVVHAAMETGALTSWDYQPKRDAAQEYVRNHMDWTLQAERSRFPPYAG
ncbi:MAG: choline-sulfatase [Rhodospirillales bacterium]|nr:choline-sulfatase [Rhodospirillales bacterium]